MENNPKPGGTIKEVYFKKDVETSQDSEPSPGKSSEEDEDVNFFSDLYPDLRKSVLAKLLARRFSSPTSNTRPGRLSPPPGEIYLERQIGLYSAINFVVLVSLGTEVYMAPSVVLERTGSVTESLLVWLSSGVCTLLIALTYGELLFIVSQSGEKFSFLLAAFTPFNRVFGPLPAFLTIWIDGLFLGPAQVSLLALLLAENVYEPVSSHIKTYTNFEVTEPTLMKQAIGAIAIGAITFMNFRNINTCLKIQHVFGFLRVLVCILVMCAGIYRLSSGNSGNLGSLFQDMKGNTTGIIKAFYQGMFSYEGWNYVITVSEETKNPLRTLPRAMVIGLPLVTILYLTLNLSFFSVLSPNEIIGARDAYLFKFEEKLFGCKNIFTPMFFTISTLSSALCIQFGISRTCFAAGREGHMPEVYTYLNVKRFVPTPAITIQAILSLLYILYIPIIDLIEYSKFILWTFHGLAFVALIVLRIRLPESFRPYKVPLFIPIMLTTMSVLATMNPIFGHRGQSFYLASAFILLGVLVYFLLVYKQKRIIPLERFNKFIRKAMNVAPPTALPEGFTHHPTRSQTVAQTLCSRERYYSS